MPQAAPLLALCLMALCSTAIAETAADRFAPQRGLNLDPWVDWLSVEETVTRPGYLNPFPDWRRHVPQDAVAALATTGFDFTRLAIDPAPFLRLGPGPEQTALITQVIETTVELQATGLKVIVDLHSVPRGDEPWGTDTILTDPALFDAHVALVGALAARLRGLDPDRTAFEVLNEPTNDCGLGYDASLQKWPGQMQRLHEAARSAAPDLPLVLSGACWGSIDGLVVLDPSTLNDENVLWTFHSYDPFFFTHQGAGWTSGPQVYFSGVPFPPDLISDEMAERLLAKAAVRVFDIGRGDVTREDLAAHLQAYRETAPEAASEDLMRAAEWADAHGIPRHRLFVGEFGSIRDNGRGTLVPEESRAAFLKAKIAAFEGAGFGWAVYSWTSSFGIANDVTRRIDPMMCRAMGLSGC